MYDREKIKKTMMMNYPPKVSILMPVYNKEFYLRRSLEAVRNQLFQDWELIIIDDGSTDNGRAIIEGFMKADSRISAYFQHNKGAAAARNAALTYATGEWIWFVDSDDVLSENFLYEVFEKRIKINTAVVAGCYAKEFPDGHSEMIALEEQGYVQEKDIPDLFMKYQYNNGFWGYLWNKLIRYSLIQSIDLSFQEGLTLAEDLKFMLSIYQHSQMIYIMPIKAMTYTVNADNSSSGKKIDYLSQLEIQRTVYSWIVNKSGKLQYMSTLQKLVSRYAAFCIFYGFEDGITPKAVWTKIPDQEYLLRILNADGIERVMRPIIRCLKKRKWLCLNCYLYVRNLIRKIYRTVYRKGKG